MSVGCPLDSIYRYHTALYLVSSKQRLTASQPENVLWLSKNFSGHMVGYNNHLEFCDSHFCITGRTIGGLSLAAFIGKYNDPDASGSTTSMNYQGQKSLRRVLA